MPTIEELIGDPQADDYKHGIRAQLIFLSSQELLEICEQRRKVDPGRLSVTEYISLVRREMQERMRICDHNPIKYCKGGGTMRLKNNDHWVFVEPVPGFGRGHRVPAELL